MQYSLSIFFQVQKNKDLFKIYWVSELSVLEMKALKAKTLLSFSFANFPVCPKAI